MNLINNYMIKHIHHIIPKHQGGTNDESNLIRLSIADHAEAHRLLYEKHGHWEDHIAYLGLAGMIDKEEIIQEIQKNAWRNRKTEGMAGKKSSTNWALNSHNLKKSLEAAHTPVATKKRKDTFARIKHAQGENNSQFGTRWICNVDLKENKKISKESEIPEGWVAGRICKKK